MASLALPHPELEAVALPRAGGRNHLGRFLALVQRRNGYEARARFCTYLYRIALNRIASEHRKKPEAAELPAPTAGRDPSIVQQVRAALERLEPDWDNFSRSILGILFFLARYGLSLALWGGIGWLSWRAVGHPCKRILEFRG
jgi:hypothetical protein